MLPSIVRPCRRHAPLLLAVGVLLGCPRGQVSAEPGVASAALAGDWIGGYRLGKRYTLFSLHLPAQPRVRPSFDLPGEGLAAAPLTDYLPAGEAVRFTLPWGRGEVALQGHLEHESLVGAAHGDGQEGSFEMRRTAPMEAAALREYTGLYDAGGGHLMAIERLPELPHLHFTDFFSGRFNAIFPDSKDLFFAGPALLVAAPAVMSLRFNRDPQGAIASVTFQQDGEPDVIAVRLATRETAVELAGAAGRRAGTLLEPATPGPHPAVVLTPGETDAARDAYRKEADFLVSQGFAALVYDRRDDARAPASFTELADDALVAVELLRARPEIDAGHVGVWGQSQGGWVAALAASRSPNVAFVINVSTPATTPAEQQLFRVEHNLRADGFPEAQILEAMNYQRLMLDWVREGTGRETLIAVHKAASAAPWAAYVDLPRSPLPAQPDAAVRDRYRHDPLPVLGALRCPALFVFGAVDSVVPVERSVPAIKSALGRRAHPDNLLKVLPRTGHGMWETDVDSRDALPLARRHGQGYWQLLATWLGRARVSRPLPASTPDGAPTSVQPAVPREDAD